MSPTPTLAEMGRFEIGSKALFLNMSQATAVVLDKDQLERDDIRNRLSHCGVLPICFQDEWICLENIHHINPFFAVMKADSYEGVYRFVNIARAIKSNFPIVVLSNKGDVENFIRNNWLVNLFFLRYPADDEEFQGTIALLSKTKQDRERPVLIAGSPERKKLIQGLPLIGLSKEPVLIQGEPGVGKRLMARAIHSCSAAKDAALDFIDAAHITGQWIRETKEWTDALNRESGCHRVSVIENVENLSFALQSQLLMLMEDSNRNEIGRKRDRTSAPFITITGSDLESLAQQGLFRKDLYHRLSVLKTTVPPLRGHSDDICAMAEFFTAQYSIRHKSAICRLPGAVIEAFVDYHWPGNVSELKRSIEQLMMTDRENWMGQMPSRCGLELIKCGNRTVSSYIDADDIRTFLENNRDVSLKKAKTRYANQVEKKIMKAALAQTNGNCKKAAGLLNISYKSMLNKAKVYQLV